MSVATIPQQGELVPTARLTPPELLQLAVARGVDTDQLKELMQLQREWKADQAREAFTEAMTAFKSEPLKLVKTKSVSFNTTSYKHATLSAVVDAVVVAMSKHGLSHRWETKQDGGVITVSCVITHRLGYSERTTLSAAPDTSGGKNSIQGVGSAVTYLQRYTLMAATGLAASDQDDDGHQGAQGEPRIDESQIADLEALMEEIGIVGQRRDTMFKAMRITALDQILAKNYDAVVRQVEAKRK